MLGQGIEKPPVVLDQNMNDKRLRDKSCSLSLCFTVQRRKIIIVQIQIPKDRKKIEMKGVNEPMINDPFYGSSQAWRLIEKIDECSPSTSVNQSITPLDSKRWCTPLT